MTRVQVALYASTPFGRAGLVSFLQPARDITVLPDGDGSDADVQIVFFPRIRPEVVATMRRSASAGHTTVVLVVDEIAGKLRYSHRTIKNVICGITRRLNLRNRPHAVAYALRAGVI